MTPEEHIRNIIENGGTFNPEDILFDINEHSFITDNPNDNTGFTQKRGDYINRYTYYSEKKLLHIAIERRNIAAIQALLDMGANPDIPIRNFRRNDFKNTRTGYEDSEVVPREKRTTHSLAQPMIEELQQMINRLAAPVAQIPQEPAVPAPQELAVQAPQELAVQAPQELAVQAPQELAVQAPQELAVQAPQAQIKAKEEYKSLEQQMSEMGLEESSQGKKEEKGKEIEYDADSESHERKKRFRKRLILGEADFSYTKSLIKKHENDLPELPKFLTATEVRDAEALQEKYQDYEDNTNYIKSQGGTVVLQVDATNIQEKFPDKQFERIHFNAPYLQNKGHTRNLVSSFFTSAQKIQNDGDRVHISLVDTNPYFWHGATYGLIKASTQAGYKLLTKRNFGNSRYEDYDHRETDLDSNSKNARFLKEFVFEKTSLNQDAIKAEYTALGILSESTESFGPFSFFNKNESTPTPYDTANDSSDYFTEEDPTPKVGFSKK